MVICHYVEFLKGQNFIRSCGLGTEIRHHARFCRNWSINRGDVAIFLIFQHGHCRQLDFSNSQNFIG